MSTIDHEYQKLSIKVAYPSRIYCKMKFMLFLVAILSAFIPVRKVTDILSYAGKWEIHVNLGLKQVIDNGYTNANLFIRKQRYLPGIA